MPFKDVPGYINAMDITVAPFPKLPDFYFSAIKILEYMAVAKPVVASRYPDTESVISDHVNGILVDPGDSIQLAQALLELLEDKELRVRLGEEARRLVSEKYTWKQTAYKIIKISENLRPQNKK
jgi:glycosyltransferase involved in cell wall biosynthesis